MTRFQEVVARYCRGICVIADAAISMLLERILSRQSGILVPLVGKE